MTGNELRALRKKLGWTQQQFADYWEIDRVTFGLYEGYSDKPLPRSKMFDILGGALEAKAQQITPDACKNVVKAIQFIESQTELLAQVPDSSQEFIGGLKKLVEDLKSIVW